MKRKSILIFVLCLSFLSQARPFFEADEVAQKVWHRPDGLFVTIQLSMELVDSNGKMQARDATLVRGTWQGNKKMHIDLFAPSSVRKVSFLTYDFLETAKRDEFWIYLPESQKVRPIPSSKRGDNFMGSEFSYEDIKNELKFPLDDYNFYLMSQQENLVLLKGIPQTTSLSHELGYGQFEAVIDTATWLPERTEFWDTQMRPLKIVEITEKQEIDGYWVATDLRVTNHQTGHVTRIYYTDISYSNSLPQTFFNVANLSKK